MWHAVRDTQRSSGILEDLTRESCAGRLFYDIPHRKSYYWIAKIKSHGSKDITLIPLGNKSNYLSRGLYADCSNIIIEY